MSDPVTNVDIEDVLASIRRLVLTGGPPGAAAMGAGPTPARSRLVLTQSQRVGEAEEPELGEPEEAPAVRPPLLVLSAPMARPEPGPRPQTEPESVVEEPAPEPANWVEPDLVIDPEHSPRANGRVAGARGIEAAVTGRAEAWDPDGSEEALDWSLGGVALATEAPVFRHRAPIEPPADPEPLPLAASAPGAAAMPARPPVRVPSSDRMFAPEDFATPPPAPRADLASPPAPDGPAHDAVMVDEAQLRAIVTEVLRAELQGELGERITRNVRKLVRREIFRVLEIREDD